LLNKTKTDYDKLATLFQEKRGMMTPDMMYLKRFAKQGDKILDLGCGFGRLNDVLKNLDIKYIGTDISFKQIALAKKSYPNKKFKKCDLLIQSFHNNSFDKIFCLSVIHHIPSTKYRIKILKEIKRVLKPQGKLILTAWFAWDNPKIKKVINKFNSSKSEFDRNDIIFPFKNNQGKVVINRYLHCFSQTELKNLVDKAGFKIEETKVLKRDRKGENKNILIVAQK